MTMSCIKTSQLKITLGVLFLLSIFYNTASAQVIPVADGPSHGIESTNLANQIVSTESDIENKIKEWGLDTIAYNLAGSLTTKLTNSVVNWANGGFQGAPSFVQDFSQYFQQQGNQVLQSSLNSLQGISQNNPFARDLALQLINSAQTGNTSSLTQGLQFNLNQVIGPNWQQFYTNPGVGGWQAWNAIAQVNNNPIGSLLYVNQSIQNQTAQLNQNAQFEALSGGGFLNIKKCTQYRKITPTNNTPVTYIDNSSDTFTTPELNPGGTEFTGTNVATGTGGSILQTGSGLTQNPQDCLNWETKTPGSTIKSSLDKALGVSQDRLTAADEFKETLSASLTTLITGLTNAGLNKLVSSFTQPPIGSVGGPSALNNINTSNGYNWLNLPGQIVDIDEQQQIRLPDGSYAINKPCPTVQGSITSDICI